MPLIVISLFIPFVLLAADAAGQKLSIHPLKINSQHSDEISIYLSGDVYYITSNAATQNFIKTTAGDKRPFDIFIADTLLNSFNLFRSELITRYNEGIPTFSPDGATMFFNGNDGSSRVIGDDKRENTVHIYASSFDTVKKTWGEKLQLPFIKKEYNYYHPCLSVSGDTLYFASDLPGGYGRNDIYYSVYTNGTWSDPVNLGLPINSESQELYPFASPDGSFYFSTNRDGNFNIYNKKAESGEVLALEDPVNTVSDELAFYAPPGGGKFFFSSNRNGTFDIFMGKTEIPLFSDCKEPEGDTRCFVFSEPNGLKVDTLNMAFEWDMGDGTKIKALEAEHCYSHTGVYTVSLNIIDFITGDVLLNQASYEVVVEDPMEIFFTVPDEVLVGEKLLLKAEKINFPGVAISGLYWVVNGKTHTGESVHIELQKSGRYEVVAGIEGKDKDGKQVRMCNTRSFTAINRKRITR